MTRAIATEPPGRLPRLPPHVQANIIGGFTGTAAVAWFICTWTMAPESRPSLSFATVWIVLYVILWGSFRIPGLRHAWDWLWKAFAPVRSFIAKKISGAAKQIVWTSLAEPSHDDGFVEVVMMRRDQRFDPSQAVRVQLLAAASIMTTAWITHSSGGPFASPYGQLLFALPVFAPIVASNVSSLVVVYLVTFGSAIFIEFGTGNHGPSPGGQWPVVTVSLVLVTSLTVAVIILKAREGEARKLAGLQQKLAAPLATPADPDA